MPPNLSRPLSPHLQIYRPMLTMIMSIMHRMTGGALYFGTLLLVWWLAAAASGPGSFNFVQSILGSPPGLVVLFGYTWALVHHMLGGLRHLLWDTGHGFALPTIEKLALFNLIGSIAITLAFWVCLFWSLRGRQ